MGNSCAKDDSVKVVDETRVMLDNSLANPDMVAIGMGVTNMTAMALSVCMGKRAVGVELRGEPFLGIHFNIREDVYHIFGLIDKLMLERYGAERQPKRQNGEPFLLAKLFYTPQTFAGHVVADKIIAGYKDKYTDGLHLSGRINHYEFIDDREKDGKPQRNVVSIDPPVPPSAPDPSKIRDAGAALAGPSTWQMGADAMLILLRSYLVAVEDADRALGIFPPRVSVLHFHRVKEDGGFQKMEDGKVRIIAEPVDEFDMNGKFARIRKMDKDQPDLDLGVPGVFSVAEGYDSPDARKLGFKQHDVMVDCGDGHGPKTAQADYMAGFMDCFVGARLRRRIASAFDEKGEEYWVRQIAVGHENDPEVGWVLVQVPDYMSFCPIEQGLVPKGTSPESPQFYAAYQSMIRTFYVHQAAAVLDLPEEEVRTITSIYGPKLFSLVERMGEDALLAANGVVAGDSFGNGHFMTSGGMIAGVVGHGMCFYKFWQDLAAGEVQEKAMRTLADGIKKSTEAWLASCATEYAEALPQNFGKQRADKIAELGGFDRAERARTVEANRRKRHDLAPLSHCDWRHLMLRPGHVHTENLPDKHTMNPEPPKSLGSLKDLLKEHCVTRAPMQGKRM